MRKLREILRLISVGDVPIREIARRSRRGAVDDGGDDRADRRCKSELAVAQEGIGDAELEALL